MWPKRTAPTLGMMIWLVVCLPRPAQTETDKPPQTITNSIGMSLVRIEPGEFWMGSKESAEELASRFKDEGATPENFFGEYPRHKVRITKHFFMGKHEVTVGEFRKFVEATNYQTEPERDGKGGAGWNQETKKVESGPQHTWRNPGWIPYDDTHPVVIVTWNDAQRFCKWLSSKEKTVYRLPTEAEWEYACRAGTETLYWNGDAPENLSQIANISGAAATVTTSGVPTIVKTRDEYRFTARVGIFPANPWGLHETHGNLAEFVADLYDANAYSVRAGTTTVDPLVTSGSESLQNRVYRGGSWNGQAKLARSAYRGRSAPGLRYGSIGFRVVSTASNVKTP